MKFIKDQQSWWDAAKAIGSILGIIILIILISSWSYSSYIKSFNGEEKYISYDLDDSYKVYQNDAVGVQFTYPKILGTPYAPSELGHLATFYFPDSRGKYVKSISFDINRKHEDLEKALEYYETTYSKNGQFQVKEIQMGGQKGYRVVINSKIGELRQYLVYFTVRNGVFYELTYIHLPSMELLADRDLPVVEDIVDSFKFIPQKPVR